MYCKKNQLLNIYKILGLICYNVGVDEFGFKFLKILQFFFLIFEIKGSLLRRGGKGLGFFIGCIYLGGFFRVGFFLEVGIFFFYLGEDYSVEDIAFVGIVEYVCVWRRWRQTGFRRFEEKCLIFVGFRELDNFFSC